MSRDLATLRRLAVCVADNIPLPSLIEAMGRRIELGDYLAGFDHCTDGLPASIALLLRLAQPSTMRDAVQAIRDHHSRN